MRYFLYGNQEVFSLYLCQYIYEQRLLLRGTMLRKIFPIILSTILIILFSSPAWSLVEGSWDINGKTTVIIKIKGYGTEKETTYFEDEFIFYDDNTFEMTDLEGNWGQERNKFTVYMEPADIEDYLKDSLEYMLDTDVDVSITSYSFYGSENKTSSKIKGKMKMKMSLYIDEYDLEGTVNVNSTFTGYRSNVYLSTQKTEDSNKTAASPMENIIKTIDHLLRIP